MKDLSSINYVSSLDVLKTQEAIKFIKDNFEELLAKKLNLTRVSAPLFVKKNSGLNDDLNGVEEAIGFSLPFADSRIEIVHSLAKWKRMALNKYAFDVGSGLYTDMNAIRKDELLDPFHSIYVDQWDWEKVISQEDRTLSYLKKTVRSIYGCLKKIAAEVDKRYGICSDLPDKITFISTKQLESLYPNLSRKQREEEICKKYKAVFLYGIGGALKDGKAHDGRAADYDDWKLNGDILVYFDVYDTSFEISSMGIRVNKESLLKQLKEKGELSKSENFYCQGIINGSFPQSIGGGIGQSRLCMFLLKKAHIGEVQVSLWDQNNIELCDRLNIKLL